MGAIERARAGDPDALAEIWLAHQHLLLRYFRGRRMADPEDLASTVWVEVAGSIHRFRGGPDDLRRWIFTIAARRRVDEIRREQRRRGHRTDQLRASSPFIGEDAGEVAERRAALDRALAMVASLPDDQAEAVLLRVVADLSVADVAEIMGKQEGAVRVLVHRGLRRLEQDSASETAGDGDDVSTGLARSRRAS